MKVSTKLTISNVDSGLSFYKENWFVEEDYELYIESLDGLCIKINKGFIFKGLTIPKFIKNLFSLSGTIEALIFHEYAYMYGYIWAKKSEGYEKYGLGMNRKYWDQLFYEIIKQKTNNYYSGLFLYYSIRILSFKYW